MIVLTGYEVGELISAGSHSSAYRGTRLSDGLPVIIKAPTAKFVPLELVNRFRNEFNIGSQFSSGLIIKYLALEPYLNGLAIVTEDFGGTRLSAVIPAGGMEIAAFLEVATRIADGLRTIHEHGVIHKDLKPANIAITPRNNAIKYLDFGISAQAELASFHDIHLAATGGTLEYISPEQTGRTNRLIDYRSDLYSLGVTLYQMACGCVPFASRDPLEIIHGHIAKIPVSPSVRNPAMPQSVSAIILRLLQKNAEDRYQSAAGVIADLEKCRDLLSTEGAIRDFEVGQYDFSERFNLPQRLYGREQEIGQLQNALERGARGRAEMLLVTGYSGVGKSAVIGELQRPVAARHGYFISGKFDQFNRGSAYSAIAHAFGELMQLILGEPEARITAWREKLQFALGENAKIVADLIPALKLIIGEPVTVHELGPVEAQNRFDLTFGKFVRALAAEQHPLVLFLDDIHHADLASLKLLRLLATDAELDHLLLVCAYRDNEVDASHPVQLAITEIEKIRGEVEKIALAPLGMADTGDLIADALGCAPQDSMEVAEEVYRKTGGNAFFVKLFLHSAYDEHLLRHTPGKGWQWDMDGIRAMQATDNVADLMLRRLQGLPQATRDILKLAATLGNTFDAATLSSVSGHAADQIQQELRPALNIGMLIQGGGNYRFVHDRIQEAAYELIPEQQRQAVHLRIGNVLLQGLRSEEDARAVSVVVNHFNIASSLIDSEETRLRLARLNLLAGRQAKRSTAYASARQYFSAGLDLLSPGTCAVSRELFFSLRRELAEAEYLTGDFARSQEIIQRLIKDVDSATDKAALYGMLVYQYTVTADYEKGIATGREGLKLLGIDLPVENLEEVLREEVGRAKDNLGGRPIASLIDSPEMTSPEHRAAIRLLMELQPTTYMAAPDLYSVIAVLMANLSLRYGHTHESAKAYVTYANILSSVLHEYHAGYEFCRLGLRMSDHYNDPVQKCRGNFIYTAFLLHWTRPFRDGDAPFNEGYQTGVECGDFQYAGYILGFGTANLYNQGMRLERLSRKLEHSLDFVRKAQHQMPIDAISGFQLAIANLRGETDGALSFDTAAMSEQQFIEACGTRRIVALSYFMVLKAQILYLRKQYGAALDCILQARETLDHIRGTSSIAEFNFYHSLILAALYPSCDAQARRQCLEQIGENQRQMKVWADNCPDNFLHKLLLVEAETARITGNELAAAKTYDQAISAAVKGDFIQNEALANELAAGFWQAFGKEDLAHIYLHHACQCYRHWGASSLVEAIERTLGGRQASRSTFPVQRKTTASTSSNTSAGFDTASILKAAQTISGEIVLDRLLEKTMDVVIENAGAQRGCLILREQGELFIAARIDISTTKEFQLLAAPVEESQEIARSIVNYVNRTGESVVLGNASGEGTFAHDPYVVNRRPKSVLCLPVVKQGNTFAILYLENNITTEAFTPARTQTLNLLASQIAVSMENALLYQSIEKKVDERTRELHEKTELLDRANKEMEQEIERRKLLEEELRRLATTDFLTGLSLRRHMFELAEKEINRAKRGAAPLSLLILDIDHFKSINDTYGHQTGDDVLRHFAAVFRNSLREIDIVCRFGGEEFVAVLPDASLKVATEVAERLRQSVETGVLSIEDGDLKYTISIGLSSLRETDSSVAQLINRADEALYHAKKSGRNRVVVAQGNLGEQLA